MTSFQTAAGVLGELRLGCRQLAPRMFERFLGGVGLPLQVALAHSVTLAPQLGKLPLLAG